MDERNYRILLVDDDPVLLELNAKVLDKLGYQVISHSDSEHALELFKDLPDQFDLVVTDFRMPGRNGAELSKEILKINPEIPIIICAGAASDINEEEVKSSGVKLFIRKPFLKNDFVNMVAAAIDNSNAHKRKNGEESIDITPVIELSRDTLQASKKCTKEFCCLDKETRDLCEVKSCVNTALHFIKEKSDGYCSYKKMFGTEKFCCCPARMEIFNKYKI